VTVFSLPTVTWLDMPRDGLRSLDGPAVARIDLATVLDAAAGAGFDAVGLDLQTVTESAAVASQVRSRGLGVTDVGVLAVGAAEPGQVAGAPHGHVQTAETLAELAAAVGATRCVTVLTAPPSAGIVAALRRCGAILAGAGVRLALEFLPYGPLATLAMAMRVCGEVGWDRCGLQLDAWHFLNSGRPWRLLASVRADQIALLQVSDVRPPVGDDLRYEGRFRRAIPGTGDGDLPRFLDIVRGGGYAGPVSVEVLSLDLRARPPAVAAHDLHAALTLCWPR
jgi:sugar phosphate isomerase/epimerase